MPVASMIAGDYLWKKKDISVWLKWILQKDLWDLVKNLIVIIDSKFYVFTLEGKLGE